MKKNTWTKARVSDDEILEEIRRVAAYCEKDLNKLLSGPLYDANRSETSVSQIRIIQRFGSWRKACELAGVESRPSVRQNYSKTWNTDEAIAAVADFLRESDERGASYAAYDVWATNRRKVGIPTPSGGTLRNRLGRWSDVYQAALNEIGAEDAE